MSPRMWIEWCQIQEYSAYNNYGDGKAREANCHLCEKKEINRYMLLLSESKKNNPPPRTALFCEKYFLKHQCRNKKTRWSWTRMTIDKCRSKFVYLLLWMGVEQDGEIIKCLVF